MRSGPCIYIQTFTAKEQSCQPCSLAAVIGQNVDPADICYDMRTDLDSDALSG